MIDNNREIVLKNLNSHLEDLYRELERRLKRYHKRNASKREINQRLSELKIRIIRTLVSIEELSGSID